MEPTGFLDAFFPTGIWHIHPSGKDTDTCGKSFTNPCKTLQFTLKFIQTNDTVYISDTISPLQPSAIECNSDILVLKSFSLELSDNIFDWPLPENTVADSDCKISFTGVEGEQSYPTLELSGLYFKDVALDVHNVSLHASGCKFSNTMVRYVAGFYREEEEDFGSGEMSAEDVEETKDVLDVNTVIATTEAETNAERNEAKSKLTMLKIDACNITGHIANDRSSNKGVVYLYNKAGILTSTEITNCIFNSISTSIASKEMAVIFLDGPVDEDQRGENHEIKMENCSFTDSNIGGIVVQEVGVSVQISGSEFLRSKRPSVGKTGRAGVYIGPNLFRGQGSKASITKCVFSDITDYSTEDFKAIYESLPNVDSAKHANLDLHISDSTFSNNVIFHGSGAFIYGDKCSARIDSVQFGSNVGLSGGGGLRITGNTTRIKITKSTFIKNRGRFWSGGGLSVSGEGTHVEVDGSIFESNEATSGAALGFHGKQNKVH